MIYWGYKFILFVLNSIDPKYLQNNYQSRCVVNKITEIVRNLILAPKINLVKILLISEILK